MNTTRTTPADTPKTSPRSLAVPATFRHGELLAVTCPACAKVPREKWIHVRADGHVWVRGGTGNAIACSIDGGYAPSTPSGQAAADPAPAPRWTLAPGRWICYDGKPVVYLGVGEDPKTAERSCPPYAADDLAHLIVLQEGAGGILPNTSYPFPLPDRVAGEIRALTPTTLPAEEVSRG